MKSCCKVKHAEYVATYASAQSRVPRDINCGLYCSMLPCDGLWNVLADGVTCHMLLFVCLLGSYLNVCAKPEKLWAFMRYSWHLHPSPEG